MTSESDLDSIAANCSPQWRDIAREVMRSRAMLRRLEWARVSSDTQEGYCPVCSAWQYNGHKPDCELSRLLAGR